MRNTTTGSVTAFALFLLTAALAAAEQEVSWGGVSYAAGDWPAKGRGNQRAVVRWGDQLRTDTARREGRAY
jgi:hypothetical protein